MNIILETQLNKELQQCMYSMSDIIHNCNMAYESHEMTKVALWEHDLAQLLKNMVSINKFKRRN